VKLIIFGDSIAYGFWDPQGGWVQRLRSELDKRVAVESKELLDPTTEYYRVYNLAISGNTSDVVLKQVKSEPMLRIKDDTDDSAIIVGIGVNDSATINDTGKNWVAPESFRKNIAGIIEKAKEQAAKVLFIGIAPVDEKRVAPCPFAPELSFRNSGAKRYEAIISEECEKAKVPFLPLFDALKQGWDAKLEDGLHPNGYGHERIFKEVLAFLKKERVV